MFCTNCGKQIADDSAFCEFCGTRLAKEETIKSVDALSLNKEDNSHETSTNDSSQVIENKELQQMASHLGFLGYEIKRLEVEENKEWVLATHPTSNNVAFFEIIPGFIMFQVNLKTGKKHGAKMDVAVNNVNKELNLARFYYVLEEGLVKLKIEAVYAGSYMKESFGQFHEVFENDQRRMIQLEDFAVFLTE